MKSKRAEDFFSARVEGVFKWDSFNFWSFSLREMHERDRRRSISGSNVAAVRREVHAYLLCSCYGHCEQ